MTTRRRSRGQIGALAASITAHVTVLALLAVRVTARLDPEAPPRATVELQLAPEPPPAPLGKAIQHIPTSAPAPRAAAHAQPLSPQPRPASPRASPPSAAPIMAPTVSSPRPGGGTLPAAEMAPDMRGAVRAIIGCSHADYLGLTGAEKARCDARVAEAIRDAPAIDPLSADRRTHLDSAAAYAARKRANMTGPTPQPFVPCPHDDPGSNFGTSCLAPEAIHHSNF